LQPSRPGDVALSENRQHLSAAKFIDKIQPAFGVIRLKNSKIIKMPGSSPGIFN